MLKGTMFNRSNIANMLPSSNSGKSFAVYSCRTFGFIFIGFLHFYSTMMFSPAVIDLNLAKFLSLLLIISSPMFNFAVAIS